MPLRPVTATQKVAVWATALLGASIFVHGYAVATPGLTDRDGRIKASDYMRLYVTGALAREGRWTELFDERAHVREAQMLVDPRVRMEGLRPNYGPTAAVALAPLSRLPFLTSWAALACVSVAIFLLCAARLAQTCQKLAPSMGLVLLVCGASPALFVALRYGQLSAITTACFLAAATLDRRGHPIASGVCLGMVAFKPHLIVPAACVWLASGRWRLLAGLCAGAALHLAIGVAVAGLQPTLAWLHTLRALASDPDMVQGFPSEVHSIRGFFRLAGASPPLTWWLTAAASAGAVFLSVSLWRRQSLSHWRWSALVTTTVLVAPHVLTYDLLLLTVPLMLLVEGALGTEVPVRRWQWLTVATYLAPLVSPVVAAASGVQGSTLLCAALLWTAWRSGSGDRAWSSSSPSISS